MFTKEESRKKIQELTENFEEKLDFIKTSGQYKEAQIEDEFIKPLFKYLNWNISNEGIKNPAEREFIVQAKGKNGKEPDYLLQLDKKPLFYIEAKHSKYDLQKRTDYIWQAYSYAYSTQTRPKYEKVDFALLTDFEEFRFFDCTFPAKNHSALNNYCVLDWTFKDYIYNFDKLWEYFERENVRNGSLSKLYINEKKIKENRISPDKAFLLDLDDEKDGWRIKLAKDIKKYQPHLSAEFITQAVQLILDRFIFIKVLSDREIEEDIISSLLNRTSNRTVKGAATKDDEAVSVYDQCKEIFEELDKTYNGSIFTKRSELDFVKVSNKVLLEVLKDLLPKNSRYNFKVIPIEILGTIYEQFLGKVVVTTDKRASIDYKPEVRKAGGVYYTPDYIVNYIVEKTVGEKLKECRKFEDLLEIKICDPACGSGSFLLAAYDSLIKWTIQYYESKVVVNRGIHSELKGLSKEERKLVYLDNDGQVRLTSKIKRDILRSCIYGVDIDAQAVEVTKMSLSLKTLENTNHYEVYNERTFFHTTILPPLEGNIKCGNSLVGTDYELIKDSLNKVNPFDWDIEYKEIISKGGFDITIGNPPYVFGRDWKALSISDRMKSYLGEKFKSSPYQMDMFSIFMELAFNINKKDGYIGQIVPNVWLTNSYSSVTRSFILKNSDSLFLTNPGLNVFQGITVDTIIYILKKGIYKGNNYFYTKSLKFSDKTKWPTEDDVSKFKFLDFVDGQKPISTSLNNIKYNLLQKIKKSGKELKEYADITRGVHPYRIGGYGKSAFTNGYQIQKDVDERPYNSKIKKKGYRPFIYGKDLKRFSTPMATDFISYGEWLAEPRNAKYFTGNRVYSRKILGERLIVTIDESDSVADQQVYITKPKNKECSHKFIAGILASKLISFYIKNLYDEVKDAFPQIKVGQLQSIPIPKITSEKKMILSTIIDIIEKLLEYNNSVISNKTTSIKETELRLVNSLEIKLDKLVYSLYDLTPEEIKIVEGVI